MGSNLRKATVGTAIALLGAFVSFGSSPAIRASSAERGAARGHEANEQAQNQRPPATITLAVRVLPTLDGISGKGMYSNKYPKSVKVRDAGAFANQIEAFGGAYHVWVGPRGWTGSSAAGADGNTVVELYPVGGSDRSGPRIEFYVVPACVGCMLLEAAPYFPNARQEYKQEFGKPRYGLPALPPLPPAPPGLRVRPLSPTLVTYSLPDAHGLMVRGVACFDGPYEFLAEARFVLPHSDAKLLRFLMQTFIRREKLK